VSEVDGLAKCKLEAIEHNKTPQKNYKSPRENSMTTFQVHARLSKPMAMQKPRLLVKAFYG